MNPAMTVPAHTAVVLPGTGSDEVFIRAAFERPLAEIGVRLIAPPTAAAAGRHLAQHYLKALDEAAAEASEPIIVGGVSFGAHLASAWALRNQERCAGLLAALPAWNGPPNSAPAALAAHASAALVREHGLDRALELAVSGVAPWLADELSRAWRRHGAALADALDAAARHPAPELTALGTLDVPAGLAACTDDDVHPAEVAYAWADALPQAAVADITLEALGADRTALGRAAVRAYLRAIEAEVGSR